ncbi:hypothetical protein ACTHGU_13620 [Chitinophagaceae bacterium MMS25-I14]
MSYTSRYITITLASSLLFAASCQQSGNGNNANAGGSDTAVATPATPAAPVAISPVGTSPEFPDAQLSVASVTATPQGDSSKVSFAFNVKNYELKSQTADTGSKQCNNSAQGQHIHFIMDNKPYKALYEPKNDIVLAKNTEHYLMAFLSRSYHESLKNKDAALVYHFKIDEKGNLKKLDDPKTAMVFYSRPKGDYLGKDTKNVLFDFYVWNGNLSADGYKVKADIGSEGGKDTTITITDWKSNFLQNLPMGKDHITLTLQDKDGKTVDGPMTTVTREFNLAEKEPMK